MKLTWYAHSFGFLRYLAYEPFNFSIYLFIISIFLFNFQVRGVLQMLQGLSSSLFYWDESVRSFCVKTGIYVTHLSQKSVHVILNQFLYAATCLKIVEISVSRVETAGRISSPTLRAFSSAVSAWLKVCGVALKLSDVFF